MTKLDRNADERVPSNRNVILWLAFVFPVGVWKMWRYEVFTLRTRVIVSGIFGVLLWSHLSNTGSYSHYAKTRPQPSVASELAKTKKNYQIDRLGRDIQKRIQGDKNPFDYAVTVDHLKFQDHDLLVCNVNNGKGSCGIYEVIEKNGEFTAFWVNGVAKSKLGSVMDRTPSSVDISAAHKAATQQK